MLSSVVVPNVSVNLAYKTGSGVIVQNMMLMITKNER